MITRIYNLKNNAITIKELNYSFILPIPFVKKFHNLLRLLLKDNSVIIISKDDFKKNSAHLLLLLSSKKSGLKGLILLLKFYENNCKQLGFENIEATVVNNRISSKIMIKNNWTFVSNHWYFGKNYLKTINYVN
ncbi:MAG: hypothetical protein WCX31_12930 [Salinivirgaceae bacterium]|jgi:hypothetical protein